MLNLDSNSCSHSRAPRSPASLGLWLVFGLGLFGVVAGSEAQAAESVFEAGAALRVESQNGSGGEGPAWHPDWGVFSSGSGHIMRKTLDGQSLVWERDAGTNGLLFDHQGRLLACQPVSRRVARREPSGTWTVLAADFAGRRFNQPNDLTLDSRGRIYFTDPRYGPRDDMQIRDEQGRTIEGVYRIDPPELTGNGKPLVTRILGRELDRPNGILVSADDRFLFIADNNNSAADGARKLWRFELQADGTVSLASRKLLRDWGRGRGPDGLKQDVRGRLFVAAGLNTPQPPFEPAADVPGGIYVLDPETGRQLDFLAIPTDEVTNCAFGGPDLRTLYVTGGGTLYSIRVREPGRVVWPAK